MVRSPKGFGKNYFTLAAIQAYSSGACAHAAATAARIHTRICAPEDDLESPPPECDDLLLAEQQPEPSRRPCHCNRFFRRRTCLVARRIRFRTPPFCRCRKTKSGIAPPPPFLLSTCPETTEKDFRR